MIRRRFASAQQLALTAETCAACIQAGAHRHLKRFLRGYDRHHRQFLFERSKDLQTCVHVAIRQRNAPLLRLLVDHCGALLEAKDARGLTPLYHAVFTRFLSGARFLLRRGACVRHADHSLSSASCRYPPFLHAVVRTGALDIVEEVVQRGADINAKDLEGKDCLKSSTFISPDVRLFIRRKMIEEEERREKQERQDLERELNTEIASSREEDSTARRTSLHPMILIRVGATRVQNGEFELAFAYWKKSWRLQEGNTQESQDTGSVWADILNKDERLHLEKEEFSQNNTTNYSIIALLVRAKVFSPEAKNLTDEIQSLFDRLLREGRDTTAMDVMRRLTTLRCLNKGETVVLVRFLSETLCRLARMSEIPFSPLLDSVLIASRCISFLKEEFSLSTRHDLAKDFFYCNLCSAVFGLLEVVLRSTAIVNSPIVSPTPHELSCFRRCIEDYVCAFPRIRGQNVFHYIGKRCALLSFTASAMETLVACSAQTRGFNRHEDSPPHLVSDTDGNTPLHVFARCWSRQFLVEQGGLQCFLDHGAHLCTRNSRGQSVRDILVSRGTFSAGELFPSLQCLAAAAIVKDANLRAKVNHCLPLKIRQILLDH